MTNVSSSAAARSAALSRAPSSAADRYRPRGFFFPISNAAGASMPPSCAPRWRPPSAPPMRPAPGTGRPPMTPARRRRSCSSASIGSGHARQGRVAGRHAADAGEDREPPPDPHAPLRGKRVASAVLDDRSGSASPRASPPRSRPPISCWSRRPAPVFSPSSPNWPAAHSFSTSSPRARAALLDHLFPGVATSPASTPRTSTIISMPASCRASC